MNPSDIVSIQAREILDSRSNPTVCCEVRLQDGSRGVCAVPSGASTGKYEAKELRDGDTSRYLGQGVLRAVRSVKRSIAPALLGVSALELSRVDAIMIALDGTGDKSTLGANATLAVSLAVARAQAAHLGIPLYRALGGGFLHRLPLPMMNILNGGRHAENNVDIQEFMLLPVGAESFSEALRMGSEIYHALRRLLKSRGLSVGIGDEGGFAPDLASDEQAIVCILEAGSLAGYRPGEDFAIGIDAAASGFVTDGGYVLTKSGKKMTADELIGYYEDLAARYPLFSVEDGLGEEDDAGWERMTARFAGGKMMLVGDDLFVTDSRKIQHGAAHHMANAVLIKPNQIGTLTETAEAVFAARRAGYRVILSHRSGETEDPSLADLSVAFSADFIKAGAPARSERTAKYNRLLEIEEELFAPTLGGF